MHNNNGTTLYRLSHSHRSHSDLSRPDQRLDHTSTFLGGISRTIKVGTVLLTSPAEIFKDRHAFPRMREGP